MPAGTGPRRPLLAIRRAETVALCTAFGLQPVVDPSNADPAHRRNRIRHELLPLAATIAERDVAALLARQAALLRDEADLLDRLAAGIDPTDSRSLAAAPPALARRAVRRWLVTACLDGHPPDAATVERVLAVARNEHRACDLIGGWRVERHARKAVDHRPGALMDGVGVL